jgi:hypothetical protein
METKPDKKRKHIKQDAAFVGPVVRDTTRCVNEVLQPFMVREQMGIRTKLIYFVTSPIAPKQA